MTVLQIRPGALIDRLRHENLVSLGDRLRARGGVDDGTDGSQVLVGPAELAEAELAGVNADADAKFTGGQSQCRCKTVAALAPIPLNVASREQGISDMVVAPQRKIEDGHD